MGEREKFSPPAVGGISLLVVFAVLCLTVFALLGLSTVQADSRLGKASAQTVIDYYAADSRAQEILAQLRNGGAPEGVEYSLDGAQRVAEYTVPISETQELQVVVELGADGGYQVLRWQAVPVGEWTPESGLNVWDGSSGL